MYAMKSFLINVKTFFVMFKQLMFILQKRHRLQSIFLLLGVFVCAMLETIGVGAVIPFVLVMFSPNDMLENKYIKILANVFKVTNGRELLIATAILLVMVYVIKNATLLVFQYYQGRFHNEIEKDLSTKQYRMFMMRPYSYYLNVNTAEVIRGLNSDIAQVAATLDAFIGLISEVITVTMMGVFIIVLDPVIALGLIGAAAFIALSFVYGFKKRTGSLAKRCRDIFYRKSKLVLESISGYKEICINQKKDYFVKEYNDINEEASKLNTSYLLIMRIPSRAIETVFVACLLGLVCMRVQIYEDNSSFVSLIGAMGVASVRILPSISSISGYINALIYNRPSMEAAYNNIAQVREEEKKYDVRQEIKRKNEEIIQFKDTICLEDITFRYDNTDVDVLKDISLTVHEGDSIGIIGESGAGKSTLLDVLLGLLIPQSGAVYMDGKNIDDIPFDWAENVGYVPQTVYLMDDTIRKNIAFGIDDADIDDNKVWECLKEAKLDEFVDSLPNGIETTLGERGVRFSGGQRQRVAIARALYHNPKILVLDEATSALDNETEKEVMSAINSFRGKLTIIIVAHRLTTIEGCDHVYEVINGGIVKRGI